MRVITGSAKGTRLQTLAGEQTRPTIERVKEAMFSAIQFDIAGRRVLDLFAGSGQLGIEALSRGASYADFVDSSQQAAAIITQNLKRCGFVDRASVYQRSAEAFLAQNRLRYGLALLDAPYASGLTARMLGLLAEDHLTDDAIVICETSEKELPPDRVGTLVLRKSTRYGSTRVTLYKSAQSEEQE